MVADLASRPVPTMSDGLHARIAVAPKPDCPLRRVGEAFAVTRLVPARGGAPPQVLVRADDASELAAASAVEPVVETGRRVVCRLVDLDDCGDGRCLARGFGFLPVGPYAVRWAYGRLRLHVAVADREETRETVATLRAAGFDAELAGIAAGDAADPATLVVLDLSTLTERQREVAQVAVDRGYFDPDGADAAVVADELGISKATLSDHLRSVRAEIGEQAFPPRT